MTFPLDWGTVADWVGAVGTGGALLSSLYFIRRDKREAAEEARGAQARLVVAWTNETKGEASTYNVIGHVRNASSEPVFDVEIQVADEGSSQNATWSTPGLPMVLPPQAVGEFKLYEVSTVRLDLRFTDANGRKWRRVGGDLKQVEAES